MRVVKFTLMILAMPFFALAGAIAGASVFTVGMWQTARDLLKG